MRRAHPPVQERPANLSLFAPERGALAEGPGGACIYNPQACALALEQAIVRAAPWLLRILPAAEGASAAAVGSEAIVLAPLFIPGDSVQPAYRTEGYTDKVGKIAEQAGKRLGRKVKPGEIRDAIHRAKENLGRGGEVRNPDVMVNPNSGDVRPKIPDGGLGDSIGNIFDFL